MTDLIRKGVQTLYDSMPKEQSNALKNLASASCATEGLNNNTLVPSKFNLFKLLNTLKICP